MLISPPFLLTRNANEAEDAWIERCMAGGRPGDGAFPLSYNLGWHGGMHLDAPMNGTQSEPVRAIADGEVVFLRQPTAQPAGPLPPDHPQAYGGWTDNGVVVIRHITEIGEGANAAVTFFSITMHLSEIDPAVQQGRRVYRKARLGTAGQIYGNLQRQIHLEVVCDADNLVRLVGRASGDLPLTADGRADAVYGALYFHLPAGAQVFGQQPLANHAQAMTQPPGRPAPPPQPLQPVHTTTEELIVGLRYAAGEGAAGDRGDAYLTTYRPDGTPLGAALQENDAEYNLYTTAKDISDKYTTAPQPAPSAVFELLRFGRVIGPDALNPADVPHWRQVRYAGGQGWVNLNAANVHKFSDADFPHWQQWRLIDDAVGQDSRCDSAVIRGWLDVNNDGRIEPREATTRLGDATIAPKLARAICKFPTEWDAATIDTRWGWLKTSTPENPEPLSNEDFEKLRAHITALAFWPGGMGINAHHWHWQPREFVRQFRMCGWLSLNELAQLLPRMHGARGALASIPWATTQARFQPYVADLNKALRKYLILGTNRRVHFLAQTYIETAMWRVVEEIGQAHQQRRRDGTLYWPAPMMQYYGAFYGRGIMQLTWSGNYAAYGAYRALANVGPGHTYADARITHASTHYLGDPGNGQAPARWYPKYDPAEIANNAYNACDSGAYYWISKAIGGGNMNINRVADDGVTTQAVGRASVLVNGGGYGYAERQAYAPFIERFLGDGTGTNTTATFVASRGQRNYNIYVDFTAQRP
jgi:predicted chitinase